ncbi:hypothetical protein H8S10_05190 [Clostridium sp. NSJ-49]|uniref:Uncharacterized protein n=1 Tax=Clostridium disporicum TaxID=84024 RepID=A0A174LHI6_9CLOT|nr:MULTISPECIES: hypothetical protein [Clostridium]MBC5624849.1 hypothetical protein [Clostridium sp. NSJ-49]MCD2500576.1 hypothetical protein [Clostridium sp. NSJ-145]MDU6340049.1 hypothetical protein [Clostridium sp.]CUP20939.1 Uncharacterised protein [Clostridium disporicum]
MGKKKNKQSKRNEQAEKILYYGIVSGLTIGVIIAFILFILTDNMFWMVLPLITLFIGFAISSLINKRNSKPRPSSNKSK